MPDQYTITGTTADGKTLTISRDSLVKGLEDLEALPYKWEFITAERVFDHWKEGPDDA